MMEIRIRGLGSALLLAGAAVASAQERSVEPMPSLAPLVERVAPAVVNISVTEVISARNPLGGGRELPPLFERFFDELDPDAEREVRGAGSGVIVDAERGYVLTNHHVIEDATEIQVTLTDNRTFDATVIGSDPQSDLAVLSIASGDLTAIPFASINDLKVGDYVVAFGNPFGMSNTVTSGIVSGLGRQFIMSDEAFEDFIQTDASINPGNSGGALVNLKGELVGINSAIMSRTGGSEGVGFAIPAEMVVSVMNRLLEFGEVRRGLLGVNMNSVTPNFAEDYGLSVTAGAIVMNVTPDSAAEAAGIEVNDVIIAIDGESVADGNQLRNRIAMKLPGEPVEVRVVRDGRERNITAHLKARDLPEDRPALPSQLRPEIESALEGVELMAEERGGLRVISIEPDTAAAFSDLQRGDLITAINQRKVASVADARLLATDFKTVTVAVERDERPRLVRLR